MARVLDLTPIHSALALGDREAAWRAYRRVYDALRALTRPASGANTGTDLDRRQRNAVVEALRALALLRPRLGPDPGIPSPGETGPLPACLTSAPVPRPARSPKGPRRPRERRPCPCGCGTMV